MHRTTLGLVLLVLAGCGKKGAPAEASRNAAPLSAQLPAASKMAVPSAPAAAAAAAQSAAAAPAESPKGGGASEPPKSFADGTSVNVPNATGLGCDAREKEGWLQLFCRKRNGLGGHPKQAMIEGDGAEASKSAEQDGSTPEPSFKADERGELRVAVPFGPGKSTTGKIEWTDSTYRLAVKEGEVTLELDVGLPLRRACATLEKEQKELVQQATKAEAADHLTAAEATKLPRFGVCRQGGMGCWAVGVSAVSAAGSDVQRKVVLDLEVIRVEAQGNKAQTKLGHVEVAPGGFELKPLQVYDYDDDGSVDVVVPYEISALPKGQAVPALRAIWSFTGGAVVPYGKGPETRGGAATVQLEFDMRPDVGSYGPYLAYLDSTCGLKRCPPRLVGPVLYQRAVSDGSFSLEDAEAKKALGRACPKSGALAVDAANPTRTAQNVACARIRGQSAEAVRQELAGKAGALCGGAQSCPLLDALQSFAQAAPPATL